MRTLALALLLSAPAAAFGQACVPETSGQKLAEIEWAASSWPAAERGLHEAEESLLAWAAQQGARRDADTRAWVAEFAKTRELTVAKISRWRDSKKALYRARKVAGAVSPAEADRNIGFIERLYRLRLYFIYGNLAPRTLDAAVLDGAGKPIGRAYAGSSWKIAISREDYDRAECALVIRSGLPAEDAYNDYGE